MAFNLKNRSFQKEIDFEPRELQYLLELSAALKQAKFAGNEVKRLEGKEIALIFEKTSTRTRSAFELAAFDQGARHLPRPDGVPTRPQGVRRRHCARAGSDVRRHRVSRQRLADRRAMETSRFARDMTVAVLSVIFSVLFVYYSRNTGHSFWVYWAPFLMAGGALLLGIPVHRPQRPHMTKPGPVPAYR